MPFLYGPLTPARTSPNWRNYRNLHCTLHCTFGQLDTQILLNDLKISSLETRRSQLKLCQLYKIVNGLCLFPSGLISTKEQTCILRSTNNLCLQQSFAHTSAHLNSFIPVTISVWSTLPNDLTHTLTFNFLSLDLSFI